MMKMRTLRTRMNMAMTMKQTTMMQATTKLRKEAMTSEAYSVAWYWSGGLGDRCYSLGQETA